MTAQKQLELSRVLTDNIVGKTQHTLLPQPAVYGPSKRVNANTATAQHLLNILARIWANELGEKWNTIFAGLPLNKDNASAPREDPKSSIPASESELLPTKDQAEKWLWTYLRGPNKLMQICSPRESQQLLSCLYDSDELPNPKLKCLITWQLAVGARFTANTSEQNYHAIYRSAQTQTETCIEEDEDMLLWLVPTLLLKCVYLMNSQPRKCWLILGELETAQGFDAKQTKLQD